MVVEGYGTFGIVFSTPRIPFLNENFQDVIKLNQVSKILYLCIEDRYFPPEQEDIDREYYNILKLINSHPNIFNSEYFMLPIDGGIIDKNKFIEMFNNQEIFNTDWLNKSKIYYNIIKSLFDKNDPVFQITYEKGEKINLSFEEFLDKINNTIDIVTLANKNRIYFDDIKLENLVLHDNKIKMIDYSNSINTEVPFENIISQIKESKFDSIFYYPYPIVPNILVFEFVGKINLIGKFNLEEQNYFKLINSNYPSYKLNFCFRKKLIDLLIQIQSNILFETNKNSFEIKVLGIENIDKIQSRDDIEPNLETKYITVDDIVCSLKLFLFSKKYNEDADENLINNAISGYKKIIKKIFTETRTQINFLLGTINQYSLGILLLNKLLKKYENNNQIDKHIDLVNVNKFINTIISQCLNIILINNTELYYMIKL